jgi:acetylornithine deacetylase
VTTGWLARVLDEVTADEAAMMRAASELVQVPSVSGSDAEHDIQSVVADDLAGDGLEVDHWELPLEELMAHPDFPGVEVPRREAWGVVARLPGRGDGPSLLLEGHIDVVPPGDLDAWTTRDAFSGRVDGRLLHGRGACDMKAGVIAARWAVRALQRSAVPLRGDVLVATVAGEEDGGLGTFGLLQRGWRADACVVPEPTGLDLVPACAGALTFRLRIRGLAAHASRRTDGISVIEKLGPVLQGLRELEATRNAEVDPLMRRWTVAYPIELGTVTAGDWSSSVPDLLVADGRLGVALDEDTEAARGALEEALARVSAADPWLQRHPVEVEWWGGQFASCRLTPGSDLRLLAGLGHIPTLHYGPGDSALAHAPDESVPLAEIATAARTLAMLALDVCGVG